MSSMSKGDGIDGRARRGVSYAGRLEAGSALDPHPSACTTCTAHLLAGLAKPSTDLWKRPAGCSLLSLGTLLGTPML